MHIDRESDVLGKSVEGRVEVGGREDARKRKEGTYRNKRKDVYE